MKNRISLQMLLMVMLLLPMGTLLAQTTYRYTTVPGDPIEARIYTLDNGLKVYLSAMDDEPRIQTYVAVRVGSKNDPAETTGLAHYFEHLMFKGTSSFGTLDWEKEKLLLDEIEALFEIYREETNEEKRAAIYQQIDSISYIASTYAIANEYDRIMTSIGSSGTNAGTSNDYTIYMENIPSNRIEHWAMVQADRFEDATIRLFHTELETVYEELNMSLTSDGRKASQALNEALFPTHPYGLQTTLGEPEHLKNPSIINIKNFFNEYYIPNNMAVVMSGDFDYDETIRIVDQYFGQLKPSPLPDKTFPPQPEITSPIVKEVSGMQAENVQIAWRFDGATSDDVPIINMIRMILSNGRTGLIDQNINQQMRTLGAGAGVRSMVDYSMFTLSGRNRSGQSLEEVKDLLFEQLDLLKRGEFPEWLMDAAINNMKLQQLRGYENNRSRAMTMAMSFLNHMPYERTVDYMDRLSDITREEVIAFANQHLRNDNYAVVYKRKGEIADVEQVNKPAITPIYINRDAESDLLKQIKASIVEPIEPIFLDYDRDVTRGTTGKGLDIFYAENSTNPTFSLTYYWRTGGYHNQILPYAASYIQFLGTPSMSAEDITNEFYRLACSFNVSVGSEETRITISGLSENMEAAMELFENLVANAVPDESALRRYVATIKNSRQNSKANQNTNFGALVNYAMYGEDNPTTFSLSDAELDAMTPQGILSELRYLWNVEHQVVFYGPQSIDQAARLVDRHHSTPANLLAAETGRKFEPRETRENVVYFAHYDANQSYLQTITKSIPYNAELTTVLSMYNRYFGGGMNAIVFQEMREKRGLAYTARSSFSTPSDPDGNYINTSYIATQNDKVIDAFDAFNDLFDNMPVSETAFLLAQEQAISNIRTQRITDTSVIWNYLNAHKWGFDQDNRIELFNGIPRVTLDDVRNFNAQYVRSQPKTYVILGHRDMVDFDEVERRYGRVIHLNQEDLFSY